jgi:hypothetical protein
MRCPDCGHETDNAAVFCPQCRYRFRDAIEEPAYGETIIDLPERGIVADESVFEKPQPEERTHAFTDRELRQMEVRLLQPSLLVVLIIALFSYTTLASVPFVPLTIAGLDIGMTGIISFTCGIVTGMVFFLMTRRSLRKFRYR